MARRAIAYTSDVILGRTGEVIARSAQREAITRYAADNGIVIAGWFEDEAYQADVLGREGIRRLLERVSSGDTVLVERVWSLSRRWPALEPFLLELQRRGARLESARLLWDCISQRARHFGTERKPEH
ncbi:MAG TPA: recombinase family protein, partial [Vicinamibacteria bacterium]|nr:recombinase family protein [Vicinamibacteria bacterium]